MRRRFMAHGRSASITANAFVNLVTLPDGLVRSQSNRTFWSSGDKIPTPDRLCISPISPGCGSMLFPAPLVRVSHFYYMFIKTLHSP